jgi:hypothetical protein
MTTTEARAKLEAAVTSYGDAHLVRRGGAAAAVVVADAIDDFAAAVRAEAAAGPSVCRNCRNDPAEYCEECAGFSQKARGDR